jgi:hypothetical protein
VLCFHGSLRQDGGAAGGFDGPIAFLLSAFSCVPLVFLEGWFSSMLVSEKKDGDVVELQAGALKIRLHIYRQNLNGHMVLGIDAPPTVKIRFPKEKIFPQEKAVS